MANIQSGGAVDISVNHKPSGSMTLTNEQTNLVDGVTTLVALDKIVTGFTDAIENIGTHRITPGVAGLYLVSAAVEFNFVVADKAYRLAIYKSDSSKLWVTNHSKTTDMLSVNVTKLMYFNSTDYIELKAVSNAGVDTVDILDGERYTYMQVQRVR